MRKNTYTFVLFAFCFCFFLPSSSTAQKIDLGIMGGISVPQLKSSGSNEISQGYASRLAATFGAFADFGLVKNFSLKVIVSYAGQGGKRTGLQPVTDLPSDISQLLPPGTTLYADFKNEAILNYLEVPVLAKLEWGEKLKYYVNAGPYIGFLLSAKQKTSGNSQLYSDKAATMPLSFMGQELPAQSFDASTDVKNDIKSTNWGITGGGGISYSFTKYVKGLLDVRGAYGLVSIQKDAQANGKSNTGALFITAGLAYSFSLYNKH